MMFKKCERLQRPQFDKYFQIGKRHHHEALTMIYTRHDKRHIAVVVGKKVARKAHDRNKLRRRVYGQVYRILTTSKTAGVYIILVKPKFAALTKKEQLKTVQNLLKRITLPS